MSWWKATRTGGKKGCVGEFHVEDSNGMEWQVQLVESTKTPGKLVFRRPAVCMNDSYEPGGSEWDIFQSVKKLLAEEQGALNT